MKRAQAAMEFLTTYGWSLMIIIVAIGGLSYMGILSPTNFLPATCKLDQGLSCPIFAVAVSDTNARISLSIANNGAESVLIDGLNFKDGRLDAFCSSYRITDSGGTSLTTEELTIPPNDEKEFFFEFRDGSAGCNMEDTIFGNTNKRKYDLRLFFTRGRATQMSLIQGSLTSSAEEY